MVAKTCAECQQTKPLAAFGNTGYKRKDGTRTPFTRCKECRAAKVAAWRVENPDKMRDKELRRAYGIGLVERAERVDEQHGLCAICVRLAPLQVDHDHSDGQLRGMLCGPCNRLLGQARDNANVLRRAAAYLEEYVYCKELSS